VRESAFNTLPTFTIDIRNTCDDFMDWACEEVCHVGIEWTVPKEVEHAEGDNLFVHLFASPMGVIEYVTHIIEHVCVRNFSMHEPTK
jgi:hypothetical protein